MSGPRSPIGSTHLDVDGLRKSALSALFPEFISEGKVDVEQLAVALGAGANPIAGPGRFSFTWAGREDALTLLRTPFYATLVPSDDQPAQAQTTSDPQNVYIEGENLEVLKLLYRPYYGRVKLIYIDPPYNTGNDFIYSDNYTDPLRAYLAQTGQVDRDGNLNTNKIDRAGRIHSSWLSMMYPRLFLARQLLREDGVICISIDDNEVHHLRLIMNEIFGEENFLASVVWQKRYSRENRKVIGAAHDYILVYSKTTESQRDALSKLPLGEKQLSAYRNPNNDPNGPWRGVSFSAQGRRPNQMYTIVSPITGKEHRPPAGSCWKVIESEYNRLLAEGKMYFGKDGNAVPQRIQYLRDIEGITPWTWWPHDETGHNDEAKREIQNILGKEDAFDTPKPVRLIKRIVQMATRNDQRDIVLDFFSGSGTTGQAVLEQNREDGGDRRFILVQLPEKISHPKFHTISEIGKARINRYIESHKQRQVDQLSLESSVADAFKVFSLVEPSIRPWPTVRADHPTDAKLIEESGADPLVPGWKTHHVLWEVALREGFSLSTQFRDMEVPGNTVYAVTDPEVDPPREMYVCLDPQINGQISRHFAFDLDIIFVCRDIALDDTIAANLALQCKLKTI